MLAKVETWVSVLIFVIWAFSAFLEYQRKKRKKAEAEAQQPYASAADEETSSDIDEEALRQAEEAAKSQAYRSTRRGEDLEVSVEDILREILLPEPIETSSEPPNQREVQVEKLGPEPKFLESEFKSPESLNFDEASSDFADEIKDAPTTDVVVRQWNRDSIFSQGFSQAILAAEILSEPRSRRLLRPRG